MGPPKTKQYTVERILHHKTVDTKIEFLVKWKNFPTSANTWEPQTGVEHTPAFKKYAAANNLSLYEVEEIVDSAKKGNKTLYFVKWTNYPSSDNTWQDEESLGDAAHMVKTYNDSKKADKKSPKKPKSPKKVKTPKKVKSPVKAAKSPKKEKSPVKAAKSPKKDKSKKRKNKADTPEKKAAKKQKPDPDSELSAEEPTEECYEVEHILKKRGRGDSAEYLIKWKNYSRKQSTWEPRKSFQHLTHIVEEFEAGKNKKSKKAK